MEYRKIQLVGNRSYSISLPKQWVISNNLKEQDTVFLDTTANNEIIIKNKNIEKKIKKSISINLNNLKDIPEFLVFCYVKNIDHVKINYITPDPEKIELIYKILKYLDGYDIISEDDSKIEISFLFNDININLQKLIIRMVYLLKFSVSSYNPINKPVIEENEMNMDRLYNLAKRILFSCLSNDKLRKENNILNQEDLFFYKDLFKKLEQIGDNIYSLGSYKISKEDIKQVMEIVELIELILIKKKNLQIFIDKIRSIKITSKNIEIKIILNKIQERCKDLYDNLISIEFNNQYFEQSTT
jgi:phosphate uptake regulator